MTTYPAKSKQLHDAIEAGMVLLDERRRYAILLAPHGGLTGLTESETLLLMQAATQVAEELVTLGYQVRV